MRIDTKTSTSSIERRALLATPLLGLLFGNTFAQSVPAQVKGQMNEAQRQMLTELPVTDWLSVLGSTTTSIQSHVQAILGEHPGTIHQWYDAPITGGQGLNINRSVGPGLMGVNNLKIMSLNFGANKRLELATFMFDRGWKDKNVDGILEHLTAKYRLYNSPVKVMEGQSEATDRYYVFDIGRFIVEYAVPQQGTFTPVYFATKQVHRTMRRADRTEDVFKRFYENIPE